MLLPRGLWSDAPPEPFTREQNWPTLLFSWWCTSFAAVVIGVRLNGRKLRSDVLFREDWIMVYALIPLFIRMILIHFVLIYGTNNIQTEGYDLSDKNLQQRSTGARLVLASRILYALFIWTSKWTVSEFLKRITIHLWRRSYELTLQGIRIFLLVTFVAVVIATLSECQPFDHYWQVVPDPGPQCRQGFAQLITMGTADIITDILLIAFPIPIVLRSGQHWTRKFQLTAIFSTSVVLIVVTGLRVPMVIANQGRQQYRTVWASSEILASAFVSNFVIIGSFLRDKGTKRNKYKASSVSDSIDRSSTRRRPTLIALHSLGSEEELFRSLGCRIPDHLKDPDDDPTPRPAPMAESPVTPREPHERSRTRHDAAADEDEEDRHSDDSLRKPPLATDLPSPAPSSLTKKNVSFFDVGGLLEDGVPYRSSESRSQSSTAIVSTDTSGGYGHSQRHGSTVAQDFAPPSPTATRTGSRAFLADLGGLVTSPTGRGDDSGSPLPSVSARTSNSRSPSSAARSRDRPPTGILGPQLERHDTDMSLQDAGGLLPSTPANGAPASGRAGQAGQSGTRDAGDLLDVGGLLSADHRGMDASAAALQRRLQQQRGLDSSSPRTRR